MNMEKQKREVRMASLSPIMEEILSNGGTVELTVTGNSMYPMLRHRVSRVRLRRAEALAVGDLPLYRRENGAFVLHRVVAREGETFTCCGDNQWVLEPGIRQEQIVAVMTHFARGKRWVSAQSRTYRGYWRFWVWLRPLRRLVFGGLRRSKAALSRLIR